MSRNRPFLKLNPEFLDPRDPVLGFIKIGGKADQHRISRAGRPWVPPIRFLDPPRFEVVTREKVIKEVPGEGKAKGQKFKVDLGFKRDEEFHALIGDDQPTTLKVRLLYPEADKNMISFLGAHSGKRWECRGDGVTALDEKRGECPCPCPRLAQFEGTYSGTPPKDGKALYPCRPRGEFMPILEDAAVFGGFWPFKTTGYESISNIMKTLSMLEGIFKRVDGLPLVMRVQAATKSYGEGQTTQPIVSLVLAANMDTARQIAAEAAEVSRKYLPAASDADREAYREAAIKEMEKADGSYAEEFNPEVMDPDGPFQEEGGKVEVESEETAGGDGDDDPDYEVADDDEEEAEAEAIPPDAEEPEVEDEEDIALEEACREVLGAASWNPTAINDRISHQRRKDGDLKGLKVLLLEQYKELWEKVVGPVEDDSEPQDELAE